MDLNLANLWSRRCACALASFLKIHIGTMYVQSGCFVLRKELVTRTSERFANNFIVLRNYEGDDVPHVVRVFSHS